MTLSSDQQSVIDEAPAPAASDGQTLEQATTLGVESVLHICELEGFGQPDEGEVRTALEAKGKPQPAAAGR